MANTKKELSQARIINLQPWEPLPGMKKYLCEACEFYFASSVPQEQCHNCEERARRALRRGGMAFLEFEAAMVRLGFTEMPSHLGSLHEYSHPDAPRQRFSMEPGERYSAALERLQSELEWARDGGGVR